MKPRKRARTEVLPLPAEVVLRILSFAFAGADGLNTRRAVCVASRALNELVKASPDVMATVEAGPRAVGTLGFHGHDGTAPTAVLTPAFFERLGEWRNHVCHLRLGGELPRAVVPLFSGPFPALASLEVVMCPPQLLAASGLCGLRSLEVGRLPRSVRLDHILAHCPRLASLTLHAQLGEAWGTLASPSLVHAALTATAVEPLAIGACPRLASLLAPGAKLAGVPSGGAPLERLVIAASWESALAVAALVQGARETLAELGIVGAAWGEDGEAAAAFAPGLPRLRRLVLSGHEHVTTADLATMLAGAPALRHLGLPRCTLREERGGLLLGIMARHRLLLGMARHQERDAETLGQVLARDAPALRRLDLRRATLSRRDLESVVVLVAGSAATEAAGLAGHLRTIHLGDSRSAPRRWKVRVRRDHFAGLLVALQGGQAEPPTIDDSDSEDD